MPLAMVIASPTLLWFFRKRLPESDGEEARKPQGKPCRKAIHRCVPISRCKQPFGHDEWYRDDKADHAACGKMHQQAKRDYVNSVSLCLQHHRCKHEVKCAHWQVCELFHE